MERLGKLRSALAEQGVDLFLTTCEPNVQYLTGFSGEDAGVVVTAGAHYLVIDARFRDQAEESAPGFPLLPGRGTLEKKVADFARAEGLHTVGVEANRLTVAALGRLEKALGEGSVRPLEGVVERLRLRKDPGEIEAIERACSVAQTALERVKPVLRPGMREKDVADLIEAEVRAAGGARTSFEIAVLAGERSSQPHGRPSLRPLRQGEPLLIDFGAWVDFYLSDLTRVLFVHSIGEIWREHYTAVLEAQQKAIDAVRPGAPLREVDAAARRHLEDRGLGEAFFHAVGHGVGREIHEAPGVGAKSDAIMVPGMVFTVEPGVYFPGRGGIRIEDMVAVTEEGNRVLSHLAKDLDSAQVAGTH
jgi:Xaa-Pro aminopeptidase